MEVHVDNLSNKTKLLSNFKSTVFRGCCGDTLLIDFNKMELYPSFLPEPQISWSDSNLWMLMFLILILLPGWVFIISISLQIKKLSNTQLGDTITALTTGLFLIPSFIKFVSLIDEQPHWSFLQSNIFIGMGYFIIFIGFCHLQQGMKSVGFLQVFKANSVQKPGAVKQTDFPTCMSSCGIESTLYFGNSLLHFGASLLYASQAGMLVTLALGISYIEIMFIRKNLGLKMFS